MANPLIDLEVVVTVESSTTVVLNVLLVETCTRYDVAPDEAFHDTVSDVGWLVAPFAGETRVGAEGASGIVPKLHAAEKALVPPTFFALTRQ